MNNNLLYIGVFLLSVIIVNSLGNLESTYIYLLIVLLSVVFYNFNRYKISITTPEILNQ